MLRHRLGSRSTRATQPATCPGSYTCSAWSEVSVGVNLVHWLSLPCRPFGSRRAHDHTLRLSVWLLARPASCYRLFIEQYAPTTSSRLGDTRDNVGFAAVYSVPRCNLSTSRRTDSPAELTQQDSCSCRPVGECALWRSFPESILQSYSRS